MIQEVPPTPQTPLEFNSGGVVGMVGKIGILVVNFKLVSIDKRKR
jgi:hypothetical protein